MSPDDDAPLDVDALLKAARLRREESRAVRLVATDDVRDRMERRSAQRAAIAVREVVDFPSESWPSTSD